MILLHLLLVLIYCPAKVIKNSVPQYMFVISDVKERGANPRLLFSPLLVSYSSSSLSRRLVWIFNPFHLISHISPHWGGLFFNSFFNRILY